MKNNNNLPFSKTQRQLRIGELLRKEISNILIKYDFHDKCLKQSSVIVSQVVVSKDIKWARTYVTSLGGDNINEVMDSLNNNVYHIQKLIAAYIHLRRMPKIIFIEDKSFSYANKINNKIKSINETK